MTDAIYYLFNAKLVLQHLKGVAVKVAKTPFICHLNVKKNYARVYETDNTFLTRAKDFALD
jgi:hypothetical protein